MVPVIGRSLAVWFGIGGRPRDGAARPAGGVRVTATATVSGGRITALRIDAPGCGYTGEARADEAGGEAGAAPSWEVLVPIAGTADGYRRAVVEARTASEARAGVKRRLGLDRLPIGTILERLDPR